MAASPYCKIPKRNRRQALINLPGESMSSRFQKFSITILLIGIPLLFFYKTILFHKIPFPGDLLMGNYEPYKSDTNLGLAPGSVPHKGQGADVIREIYPWN